MSEQHLAQKNAFRKLFDSGIEINWKEPRVMRLICQGVPSAYRSRVWCHLIDNFHGITPKYYETLLLKAETLLSLNAEEILPDRSRTVTHLNRI